jgi:hypothetical protein
MRPGILLIIFLLSETYQKNPSLNTTNEMLETHSHSEHYLVRWKAWQALSVIGCVGTLSNTILIYTFYTESSMATSVNAMIMMETVYRMVYITSMHWRTYNMVQDTTLFSAWMTREEVSLIQTSRMYYIRYFNCSCRSNFKT